jgi:hypothetical protein
MEGIYSFGTMDSLLSTRYYHPEDRTLHSHRLKALESNNQTLNWSACSRNPSVRYCVLRNSLQVQILFKLHSNILLPSRNSSVGIGTSYGLDGRVSIAGRSKWYFSTPQRPRPALRPTQPPASCGLYPWGYSGRDVKMTAHLHLVPRPRMTELYLHSHIRLHGVLLN